MGARQKSTAALPGHGASQASWATPLWRLDPAHAFKGRLTCQSAAVVMRQLAAWSMQHWRRSWAHLIKELLGLRDRGCGHGSSRIHYEGPQPPGVVADQVHHPHEAY